MEEITEPHPAPAACFTVLTLLNPLNSPTIPVPPEALEDYSHLPPSLRPFVKRVFQLYRRKGKGKTIAVGEFRAIYERITGTERGIVRAVEPVKQPYRPLAQSKWSRNTGKASPARSHMTITPFLASSKGEKLSTRPKRPVKDIFSYTQQYDRRRSSEIAREKRDCETAQVLFRRLNLSFASLKSGQYKPVLGASRLRCSTAIQKA
jgi:hypothetical protein